MKKTWKNVNVNDADKENKPVEVTENEIINGNVIFFVKLFRNEYYMQKARIFMLGKFSSSIVKLS